MKGTAAIIYAAGADTVSIHLALASLSDSHTDYQTTDLDHDLHVLTGDGPLS